MNRNNNPNYLRYFEIPLLEHCNLNCAGCVNFSGLAEEKFIGLNEVKEDLIKFHNKIEGKVEEVRITGGEPLLNEELLIEYLVFLNNLFTDSRVTMITNGLLLDKMSEEFYAYIRENDVQLFVSNYFGDEYKKKLDEIIERRNLFSSAVRRRDTFMHFFMQDEKVFAGDIEYQICQMGGGAPQLKDGRIYMCPMIANIDIFSKKYNKKFEVNELDYLKIDDVKDLSHLVEFLNENKDNSFCSYCNIKKSVKQHFLRKDSVDEYDWMDKEVIKNDKK